MCDKPAGSKLNGLLKQKCPKCRRGKVFTHPFYNLAHYSDMPKNCVVCGHQFEIEPGYFYSAMYIGYMMTSAMCIIMGAIVYFLLPPAIAVTALIVQALFHLFVEQKSVQKNQKFLAYRVFFHLIKVFGLIFASA